MLGQIPASIGVSVVVIATPGPDTALTIRNALLGGRSRGVVTALGIAIGQAIWAVVTAAGLASLLQASQSTILALRIAGAGYLVYLGGRALAAARRGDQAAATTLQPPPRERRRSALRQGLISNLANPKMVVFFLSLLPQFTGAHASFATLITFGLIFSTLTLVWLSAYSIIVAKAGDLLQRTAIRRTIDALTGTVLIALGLRIATEHA